MQSGSSITSAGELIVVAALLSQSTTPRLATQRWSTQSLSSYFSSLASAGSDLCSVRTIVKSLPGFLHSCKLPCQVQTQGEQVGLAVEYRNEIPLVPYQGKNGEGR